MHAWLLKRACTRKVNGMSGIAGSACRLSQAWNKVSNASYCTGLASWRSARCSYIIHCNLKTTDGSDRSLTPYKLFPWTMSLRLSAHDVLRTDQDVAQKQVRMQAALPQWYPTFLCLLPAGCMMLWTCGDLTLIIPAELDRGKARFIQVTLWKENICCALNLATQTATLKLCIDVAQSALQVPAPHVRSTPNCRPHQQLN